MELILLIALGIALAPVVEFVLAAGFVGLIGFLYFAYKIGMIVFLWMMSPLRWVGQKYIEFDREAKIQKFRKTL